MSPNQPAFVLVRPQMGENIGSSARAMWNFGLVRMRIVAPRDGWPNSRAAALASGAGRLLDDAAICATTAEAVSDCTHVYATTARRRDLVVRTLTPESAMGEAASRIADGEKVAVLFGPERSGLENDDIARANTIVAVPTNPEFPSLNLAQCVLLTAYEWLRASQTPPPVEEGGVRSELATAIEVEKLAEHYEARLEAAGFFFPDAKAEGMKTTLRNLWSRMPLTASDVRILHGIIRQMARRSRRDDQLEGEGDGA